MCCPADPILRHTIPVDLVAMMAEACVNLLPIYRAYTRAISAYSCVLVKRILRKYRYPPDNQEKATQTVLEPAALLSETWAAAA